jgi:hypothetical protein
MNRRVSKFIHKSSIATGATGDQLRTTERVLKRAWYVMTPMERGKTKKAIEWEQFGVRVIDSIRVV